MRLSSAHNVGMCEATCAVTCADVRADSGVGTHEDARAETCLCHRARPSVVPALISCPLQYRARSNIVPVPISCPHQYRARTNIVPAAISRPLHYRARTNIVPAPILYAHQYCARTNIVRASACRNVPAPQPGARRRLSRPRPHRPPCGAAQVQPAHRHRNGHTYAHRHTDRRPQK